MFFVLGLPGVVLAAIAWLTLSDPRNVPVSADGVASTEPGPQQAPLRRESQPGIREAVHKLARNRTYRRLLLVCSAANFTSAALAMWVPSFFIRGYGMKTGELGAYLAATGAFGGIIGHYLTGEWTYRRSAANEPRQLRAIAIAYGVMTGLSVLIYLSPNRWYALGIWMLFTMVSCVATAPLFAMIQSLFPGRMRALAMNVFTFIIGVAGLGLGPLVAGILSDELRGWGGQQSLRYASLIVCPVYLVAAWHALRASTTVAADLTLVNQQLIEPDAGDPAPVPFVTEENAR
jgi:MFS family permease